MTDSSGLSRRGFLQAGMLAGAGALAAGALAGCAPRPQEIPHPETASQEAHTYWLGEEPAVADADIRPPATPTSSSSAPATPV
ncbi:MAG: twin-arginine translocation signal domain-containing protein [Adlercreutzia equolifaciens]